MSSKKFTKQELSAILARIKDAAEMSSISDIARLAGVKVTTFHNYFSGRNILPMRVLDAIAERCNVSVDYLLTGDRVEGEYKIEIIKLLDGTDIAENPQTRELLINVIKALPRKSASSP